MTRFLAVLALAGFSCVAVGAPPTADPVEVNVANQPLTVNPLEQYTELSEIEPDIHAYLLAAGESGSTPARPPSQYDTVLRGFTLAVDATQATVGQYCRASVTVVNAQNVTQKYLEVMTVVGGSRDSRYQPVQNLRIPAGYRAAMEYDNTTAAQCRITGTFDLKRL